VTALAAHLSTPVVNVQGTTELSTVIFVALEETQKSPPTYEKPLSLLAAQPCPRPIQPHLPTPVKISNLLYYFSLGMTIQSRTIWQLVLLWVSPCITRDLGFRLILIT